MSIPLNIVNEITNAMTGANNGIVGLVDVLLNGIVDHAVKLEWRKEEGLAISHLDEDHVPTILKVRPSVLRSILARIAVICCAYTSQEVSPYGGTARIPSPRDPDLLLKIHFQNTSTAQTLVIFPEKKELSDVL